MFSERAQAGRRREVDPAVSSHQCQWCGQGRTGVVEQFCIIQPLCRGRRSRVGPARCAASWRSQSTGASGAGSGSRPLGRSPATAPSRKPAAYKLTKRVGRSSPGARRDGPRFTTSTCGPQGGCEPWAVDENAALRHFAVSRRHPAQPRGSGLLAHSAGA